ncbi:AbrB/MazE/SpoVT family DNA-binding domain-containing protein [Sporosarcina sp. FSL K6-2383]|uniref:AbrB/MazE/SpoVT family DNA-binding domain-containing protein n=1 Tax=Sporosarcina sp. FSL K6-2383 TaxID=2921556 RepID=UPI003159C662
MPLVNMNERRGIQMEETYSKNVRLRPKGQVTIPNEVIELLQLHTDDNFKLTVEDGRIVLIPMMEIAKDQAWFWKEAWQAAEQEAQYDIEHSKTSKPLAIDQAIAWLDEEED